MLFYCHSALDKESQLKFHIHPLAHVSRAQLGPDFCDVLDCNPPGSSVHEDFPSKNTGVVCHAVLQEIFPT